MIKFVVNKERCISCGQCAADCLVSIIDMVDGHPSIARQNGPKCIRCQHCLAICPTAAISILGVDPAECLPVTGELPHADKIERLIKARRSVRRYKKEDLDPALIQRLLDVASYAPTGKNVRQVRFTVIDNRQMMDKFRTQAMDLLAQCVREGKLPPGMEFFADHVKLWETAKVDIIFRGAPHLVIASAPKNCPAPEPDCLIALAYFELFAQSLGVGTVWTGLAKWLINVVLPELKISLGIPQDHVMGYVMAFGKPLVGYARTVKHAPNEIVKVSF
jgi:nitroreductase/NAD-dependent dihydropyrimidine dehydrogenase PreA subunit